MTKKPRPAPEPSPPVSLDTSGTITISLALDGHNLQCTTPSGRVLHIPLNMQGLLLLQSQCKWAHSLVEDVPAPRRPGLTPQDLAQIFSPQDYTRVCHCGLEVTSFMERCEGCPGASGAGKIKVTKLDRRGRVELTLADLGLEDEL